MCLDTNGHTTTHFYTLAAQVTSTLFGRNESKTTTWRAGARFFPLKLPAQLRPVLFTELASGLCAVAAGCVICLPDHFLVKLPKTVKLHQKEESVLITQVFAKFFTTWMSPLHNGDSWWVTPLIFFIWSNLISAPILDSVTRGRIFSKVWNWMTFQQVAKASGKSVKKADNCSL